jgi:hypothetical protein
MQPDRRIEELARCHAPRPAGLSGKIESIESARAGHFHEIS